MFELQIQYCREPEVQGLSDLLMQWGAVAVTLTDPFDFPIFEPELDKCTLWPEVALIALFSDETKARLAEMLLGVNYPHFQTELRSVEKTDWERNYLNYLKPQVFGNKLCICPSHYKTLILDPGLAFGSGTHPTTALCLEQLAKLDLNNKTILDYGCGSGILAIAAVLLGCKYAYAVDIDSQALLSTRMNAEKNQLSPQQIRVLDWIPEDGPLNLVTDPVNNNLVDFPVDLIIANILLNPLLDLKNQFLSYLKPEGILLVSGILNTQKDELIAAYEAISSESGRRFQLIISESHDDWAMLGFTLVGN